MHPPTSGEIAQAKKPGTSAEVGFVGVDVLESRGYYVAVIVKRGGRGEGIHRRRCGEKSDHSRIIESYPQTKQTNNKINHIKAWGGAVLANSGKKRLRKLPDVLTQQQTITCLKKSAVLSADKTRPAYIYHVMTSESQSVFLCKSYLSYAII